MDEDRDSLGRELAAGRGTARGTGSERRRYRGTSGALPGARERTKSEPVREPAAFREEQGPGGGCPGRGLPGRSRLPPGPGRASHPAPRVSLSVPAERRRDRACAGRPPRTGSAGRMSGAQPTLRGKGAPTAPRSIPPPPPPAAPGLRARRYRMTPGTGVRRRGLTAAPPAAAPGSAIAPIAIAIAPIAIPAAPPPIPARSPPSPHLPGVRRSPPLRRGALVGGRPRPAPPAADWPRRPPLPPHANDEGSRAAPIGCSADRAPRPGPAPRGAAPSP